MLLSRRMRAGVYLGLDSNRNLLPVDPPAARLVGFCIFRTRISRILSLFTRTGAGGEVANAQVCKTCTRGFDSRSALQLQPKG